MRPCVPTAPAHPPPDVPLYCMCVLLVHPVLQFDALQTCSGPSAAPRRPPCNNLLDVFTNIRSATWQPCQHMPGCPRSVACSICVWKSAATVSLCQGGCAHTGVASVKARLGTDDTVTALFVLSAFAAWSCFHGSHRDDEIEHVKTMNACQDPAKIASDLAARRNGGV
jgi:hypothetical protein